MPMTTATVTAGSEFPPLSAQGIQPQVSPLICRNSWQEVLTFSSDGSSQVGPVDFRQAAGGAILSTSSFGTTGLTVSILAALTSGGTPQAIYDHDGNALTLTTELTAELPPECFAFPWLWFQTTAASSGTATIMLKS